MDLDAAEPQSLFSADVEAMLAAAGAAAGSGLSREYRVLRQLVDGTAAAIAVMDTKLRYLHVNPQMALMNGVPAEAHLGRTLAEVLPGVRRDDDVLHQILDDGRPRQLVGSYPTTPQASRSHREWRAAYHRLEDEQGRPVGLFGIGLEVTEPRQYLHELERAHQRMALLDTAATSIGTTLDVEATCTELVDFVVPGLADAASVELFESDRPGWHARTPPKVMRLRRVAFRAPADLIESLGPLAQTSGTVEYDPDSPLRRALDEGRPWHQDLLQDGGTSLHGRYEERVARYRAAGIHSALVVPLATETRPLGTLTMVRRGPSPAFGREDSVVAEELAMRAARALERAMDFAREHHMALELQRALLSEPYTPHPGLETASRYLPADNSTLVGGDWFDSLALPCGRNLLVIGDVMGHGVEAAVAMSHYRSMLRAMASSDLALDEVLRQADRMVAESGFERVATCLLALGDPRKDTITYASAGHLPPVRLTPAGQVELVPIEAGPPLGTGLGQYSTVTRPGLPGGTLLLYTDGLVERRGEDIDVALHRLTQLRLDPKAGLEDILDAVLAQLDNGPAQDDTALLAARTRPQASNAG